MIREEYLMIFQNESEHRSSKTLQCVFVIVVIIVMSRRDCLWDAACKLIQCTQTVEHVEDYTGLFFHSQNVASKQGEAQYFFSRLRRTWGL